MHDREVAGVRRAIAWLHKRADEMNDGHAKAILNTAGFHLGVELTEWRKGARPPSPALDPATGHDYLSTACYHGLHERCRKTCKFCATPCRCECHRALAKEPSDG